MRQSVLLSDFQAHFFFLISFFAIVTCLLESYTVHNPILSRDVFSILLSKLQVY